MFRQRAKINISDSNSLPPHSDSDTLPLRAALLQESCIEELNPSRFIHHALSNINNSNSFVFVFLHLLDKPN